VAFLLFLPALGGDFIRDDHFLIERHPFLRAGGWLGRLLLGDFWAPVSGATGMWRPMVVFSYWLDGRLSGWSPVWFHAVNSAAHALASALVAWVALAAGGGRTVAWLAALAFAVMPAHAECVAWISGRTDVFCALFGLLALWLDLGAHGAGRSWPGVLAPLALALALLSKEAGATLIGVLAIMQWTRRQEGSRWVGRAAVWLLPYALVTAAYLVAHAVFAPDPGTVGMPDPQSRAAMRSAAWALFPGYVAFLWPWFPHSPDRAAPTLAADHALETAIGAICVAVVVAWFLLLLRRRSRLAVPVALALFPLAPPLALASLRGYGLFGERHVYVSSAGVAWALALGASILASRVRGLGGRLIAGGLAGLFLAGSAVETLRALPAYRDDDAMYRTMTEREPGNPVGYVGLASVLTERGRLDEAASLLAQADRIDPHLASVHAGRARVASRREQWDVVLAESERALELDPQLQPAQLLRALALMRLRRLDEAGRALGRLREQYPGHPEVGTVWGQYLLATGRPAEALPVLEAAAALLPGEPSLWDAVGVACAGLGRREEARAAFQRTVSLAPGYLEGWLRLAAVCQLLGDAGGRDQALARANGLPGGPARVTAFVQKLGTGAR
jgi:protein O-mannosyl-transferase